MSELNITQEEREYVNAYWSWGYGINIPQMAAELNISPERAHAIIKELRRDFEKSWVMR